MKKGKKQAAPERKGIFGNAIDYSVYHMTARESLIGMAVAYLLGVAVMQVFFQTWIVSLILPICLIPLGKRVYQNMLREKRNTALILQFKEMLGALSTSYDSGKNTTEAFQDAYRDMRTLYGEDAYIVKELEIILKGIQNNITVEAVLEDFAKRSDNEDIESFGDVFSVSNRAGGNIKDIIAETKNVMTDKINIEMEIETLISGKKNEMNIMILLPFVVVTQIQGFQGGGGDLRATLISVISRVVALLIFVAAYIIGQKMVRIEI